jgi:hypothetical protein
MLPAACRQAQCHSMPFNAIQTTFPSSPCRCSNLVLRAKRRPSCSTFCNHHMTRWIPFTSDLVLVLASSVFASPDAIIPHSLPDPRLAKLSKLRPPTCGTPTTATIKQRHLTLNEAISKKKWCLDPKGKSYALSPKSRSKNENLFAKPRPRAQTNQPWLPQHTRAHM